MFGRALLVITLATSNASADTSRLVGGDNVFAAQNGFEPNAGVSAWCAARIGDHFLLGGDFALETATRGDHEMAVSLQPIIGALVPFGPAMIIADVGAGRSLQFDPWGYIFDRDRPSTSSVWTGSARLVVLFELGTWSPIANQQIHIYAGGGAEARAPLTFDAGGVALTASLALTVSKSQRPGP